MFQLKPGAAAGISWQARTTRLWADSYLTPTLARTIVKAAAQTMKLKMALSDEGLNAATRAQVNSSDEDLGDCFRAGMLSAEHLGLTAEWLASYLPGNIRSSRIVSAAHRRHSKHRVDNHSSAGLPITSLFMELMAYIQRHHPLLTLTLGSFIHSKMRVSKELL